VILSNVDILAAIDDNKLVIDPLGGRDVSRPPFNTSSIDLRLGETISVPKADAPIEIRPDRPYNREFYARNSTQHTISAERPYNLEPRVLVLAQTLERVTFPIIGDGPYYAARIEGRSSLARYGLLVHFTAPTIHAGFSGPITLEMINFGHYAISLHPNIYICQLIIECLSSCPSNAPNQFRGQAAPTG
jgi:dCTP deaminase